MSGVVVCGNSAGLGGGIVVGGSVVFDSVSVSPIEE